MLASCLQKKYSIWRNFLSRLSMQEMMQRAQALGANAIVGIVMVRMPSSTLAEILSMAMVRLPSSLMPTRQYFPHTPTAHHLSVVGNLL